MRTYDEQTTFVVGTIIGAFLAGALCGLLPLFVGRSKGRAGLGVLGMLTCIVSGIVLGLLLAGPMALVFTLVIVLLGPGPNQVARPTPRKSSPAQSVSGPMDNKPSGPAQSVADSPFNFSIPDRKPRSRNKPPTHNPQSQPQPLDANQPPTPKHPSTGAAEVPEMSFLGFLAAVITAAAVMYFLNPK